MPVSVRRPTPWELPWAGLADTLRGDFYAFRSKINPAFCKQSSPLGLCVHCVALFFLGGGRDPLPLDGSFPLLSCATHAAGVACSAQGYALKKRNFFKFFHYIFSFGFLGTVIQFITITVLAVYASNSRYVRERDGLEPGRPSVFQRCTAVSMPILNPI